MKNHFSISENNYTSDLASDLACGEIIISLNESLDNLPTINLPESVKAKVQAQFADVAKLYTHLEFKLIGVLK